MVLLSLLFLIAISCSVEENSIKDDNAEVQYLKENAAITSASVRSINESQYVREITLSDFAKTSTLPKIFGLDTDIFKDDGLGNDLKAGDGIYTSEAVLNHSNEVKFTNYSSKSATEFVFASDEFKYVDQLKHTSSANAKEAGGEISIGCKIGFMTCSQGATCNACYFYNATCFYLYDCEFKISIIW